MVCVPLYGTLGDEALEYIVDHSETRLVVVAAARLPLLAKALPKLKAPIEALVYWGDADAAALQVGGRGGRRAQGAGCGGGAVQLL
jgi:long-chain acyl-CoA synthetase